ncbi:MAG TPA: hypothetical protein P5567_01145 [Kiritimatiellia bacterium]|nr:hypothetical protein [Kiritimatiellia bacterium]HRZ11040.1 hypothetical protein [Kiritimatiellia bacterium]HSA18613.1 hypothetical protein [Kiritimatiellia bacterium]
MNGVPASRPRRAAAFLLRQAPLLLVGAVILWGACRIQTYICAQDPSTYIDQALRLLRAPWGSPEMWQALTRYSPLHTLVLAGSIRCFGTMAPYWVNVFFAWAFLACLWWFLARLWPSAGDRALALAVAVTCLLAGHDANIQFLVYPFREASAFFFIFLSYGLLLKGDAEDRRSFSALAGLAMLLGVAAREPFVMAVPGPLLLAVTGRGRPWARRLAHAGLFLLPFLLAGGAWFTVTAMTGQGTTAQFKDWAELMQSHGAGTFAARTLGNVRYLAGVILGEIGWSGVALLAAGLYPGRRARIVYLLLVVPALTVGLFYSTYNIYMRYVMSVLLFLGPWAGTGLLNLLALARFLARGTRLRLAWAPLAGSLLLLGSLAVQLASLPASPFTRREVGAFLGRLSGLGTGTVYYVERMNRDIWAALRNHTHLETSRALDVPRNLEAGRPMAFLKPLNAASRARAKGREDGVRIEELLLQSGDLVPWPGVVEPWRLGRGAYAVLQVVPRSRTSVSEPVAIPAGTAGVLWLNFRDVRPEAVKKIRLLGPDGRERLATEMMGQGLQPVWWPGDPAEETNLVLETASSAPLPARVYTGFQPAAEAREFPLDARRLLSATRWFEPPFGQAPARFSPAVFFSEGGRLRLPWPNDPRADRLQLSLEGRVPPDREKTGQLTVRSGPREVPCEANRVGYRSWNIDLTIERESGAREAVLELSYEPVNTNRPLHLTVSQAALRYFGSE